MLELRYEVIKAFQEALKSESKAEHGKSHILESHGQIILPLRGTNSKKNGLKVLLFSSNFSSQNGKFSNIQAFIAKINIFQCVT